MASKGDFWGISKEKGNVTKEDRIRRKVLAIQALGSGYFSLDTLAKIIFQISFAEAREMANELVKKGVFDEVRPNVFVYRNIRDQILAASSAFNSSLSAQYIPSLKYVVESACSALTHIWQSPSIYLRDPSSSKLLLVARATGSISDSPYSDFTEPTKLLGKILVDHADLSQYTAGKRFKEYDLDAEYQAVNEARKTPAEAWIEIRSIQDDLNRFHLPKGPGKIIAIPVYRSKKSEGSGPTREIIAIITASMRVLQNDDRIENNADISYRPNLGADYFRTGPEEAGNIWDQIKTNILHRFSMELNRCIGDRRIEEAWREDSGEIRLPPAGNRNGTDTDVPAPVESKSGRVVSEKGKDLPYTTVRPIILKRRSGGRKIRLEIEPIHDPRNVLWGIKEKVVKDLFEVFRRAWQPYTETEITYPGFRNYLEEMCISKAEKILVVRTGGKIVGFATFNREEIAGKKVHSLGLTTLMPEVQGKRLSVLLNKIFLKEALIEAKGRILCKTRTASNRVVGAVTPGDELFPNPFNPQAVPTGEMKKVVDELAERMGKKGFNYDPTTSISKGDMAKALGFVYDNSDVQFHADPKINRFCESLDRKRGDAFIIFGYFSRWVAVRSVLRSARRKCSNFLKTIAVWVSRRLTSIFS
ncbi:MAG: hypothetical protein ABIB65_03945 [Candidatus Margulisiibacteriota bacterium]